jgi:4-hydroxy-2-oxoheptanedioate aldolase
VLSKQRKIREKTVVAHVRLGIVLNMTRMRASKVLRKLRTGGVARICNVGNFIPYFPHVAASFGYDGVWVDAEHRAWNPREIETMIAQHHLADIDCLWRTPTLEKSGLARLLEDGATALMIPQVNTAERARQLVMATKFPPLGDRGIDGCGMDGGFWVNKPDDYPQRANDETFLVVQIETPMGVQCAEAIAAVEGVDAVFVGPSDLSLRLGCKGSLQEPKLRTALETTVAACKKHGKPWGYPVATIEDARTVLEMGCQLIVLGSEFWAIHKDLKSCSAKLDAVLGESKVRTQSDGRPKLNPAMEDTLKVSASTG